MAFQPLSVQPVPRAADLDDEAIGPGLFPGEVVYTLDSGELVALSIDVKWLPSNHGVVLIGSARWVDEDGRSHLYDGLHQIRTVHRHTVSTGFFAAIGQDEIAREVALLMLGEEPTLAPVHVDPEAAAPENVGAGVQLEPLQREAPLVPFSTEIRAQASIRSAIDNVRRSRPADVSKLLG